MKSGLLLIPLLLLSLVIHGAQGMEFIRKGSLPFIRNQFMSHEKTNEDVVGEFNTVWKSKLSGRARKLMITSPIPTTTTISKDEKKKKKKEKENTSVNSSSTTEQRRPAAGDKIYPGILDIAGMDYSQARRKPPIHN